jgi:hypothetical protein
VVFGQREHGQPLWHVLFEPACQFRCATTITGNEVGERGLGLGQIVLNCRPMRLRISAFGAWWMAFRARWNCQRCQAVAPPGGAQTGVIVRDDEGHAASPPGYEAFEKPSPVNLCLRQDHGDAENASTLIWADPDRG